MAYHARNFNGGNGSKKTQFLPFHPHQPTMPSIKPNKSAKFHPYTSLASNTMNKSSAIATNIKGIRFHPHRCLQPLPKQSNDGITWQLKWIEQFNDYKKECQGREEELYKELANKNDEFGNLKSMYKQKTAEIDEHKLASENAVKLKLLEIGRLQSESKAKNEIMDQKVKQYKSKCEELTEIVHQKNGSG